MVHININIFIYLIKLKFLTSQKTRCAFLFSMHGVFWIVGIVTMGCFTMYCRLQPQYYVWYILKCLYSIMMYYGLFDLYPWIVPSYIFTYPWYVPLCILNYFFLFFFVFSYIFYILSFYCDILVMFTWDIVLLLLFVLFIFWLYFIAFLSMILWWYYI